MAWSNGETVGTAPDETTTYTNIDTLTIPAESTVKVLGRVIVYAKRVVIDGKLNGNGGGYLGGDRRKSANAKNKRSGQDGYCLGLLGGSLGQVCFGGGEGGWDNGGGAGGGHGKLHICYQYNSWPRLPLFLLDVSLSLTSVGLGGNGGHNNANKVASGGSKMYLNMIEIVPNTNLLAGSGGGGGSGHGNDFYGNSRNEYGGKGGNGGAAILFFAKEIEINGVIQMNGKNGETCKSSSSTW